MDAEVPVAVKRLTFGSGLIHSGVTLSSGLIGPMCKPEVSQDQDFCIRDFFFLILCALGVKCING